MKKLIFACLLTASFLLGYSFRRFTANQDDAPHVTGIGGIFFKAKDPAALKAWYGKNLGLRIEETGANFEWHQGADSTKKGFTLWAIFKESTKYFQPSDKPFMINYRVKHLSQMLVNLKTAGILPADSLQKTPYGDFIHLMDPEGNKIELWEPNDIEFAKMSKVTTK